MRTSSEHMGWIIIIWIKFNSSDKIYCSRWWQIDLLDKLKKTSQMEITCKINYQHGTFWKLLFVTKFSIKMKSKCRKWQISFLFNLRVLIFTNIIGCERHVYEIMSVLLGGGGASWPDPAPRLGNIFCLVKSTSWLKADHELTSNREVKRL